MKEIKTHNVTLDTSFIESENFLMGSKIQEVGKLSQSGVIKLHIVDLALREVHARFHKNLKNAEEKIKALKSSTKVLKNIYPPNVLWDQTPLDIDEITSIFKQLLDDWIKTNKIVIISSKEVSSTEIFDDYFEGRPPFKEGPKKSEFPDAFIIKAAETFFKKTKEITYLISMDNDMLTIVSETIIPTKDTAVLINNFLSLDKEKRKWAEFVEMQFENQEVEVKKDLEVYIRRIAEDEVVGTEIDGLEIESLIYFNLIDIAFEAISLVEVSNTFAKMEVSASVSFELEFSAKDFSEASYDKEDGEWLFVKTVEHSINDNTDLTLYFEVDLDIENESAEFNIISVNGNDKTNFLDTFRRWY